MQKPRDLKYRLIHVYEVNIKRSSITASLEIDGDLYMNCLINKFPDGWYALVYDTSSEFRPNPMSIWEGHTDKLPKYLENECEAILRKNRISNQN